MSDGVVSPHVCAHMGTLRGVVLTRCDALGSAVDACRDAPGGRDRLSAQRMAMVSTFREPSRCRPVHRELLRNALLELTLILPTTACYQRIYVETYSKSIQR